MKGFKAYFENEVERRKDMFDRARVIAARLDKIEIYPIYNGVDTYGREKIRFNESQLPEDICKLRFHVYHGSSGVNRIRFHDVLQPGNWDACYSRTKSGKYVFDCLNTMIFNETVRP